MSRTGIAIRRRPRAPRSTITGSCLEPSPARTRSTPNGCARPWPRSRRACSAPRVSSSRLPVGREMIGWSSRRTVDLEARRRAAGFRYGVVPGPRIHRPRRSPGRRRAGPRGTAGLGHIDPLTQRRPDGTLPARAAQGRRRPALTRRFSIGSGTASAGNGSTRQDAAAGHVFMASRCQYGSMIVACMVYPASPTSFRCACALISPVTHTGSNSSFSG